MTFDTKLTMALAGCSGSCSANKWHTLSVALPCFRATNPKTLQKESRGQSASLPRGPGVGANLRLLPPTVQPPLPATHAAPSPTPAHACLHLSTSAQPAHTCLLLLIPAHACPRLLAPAPTCPYLPTPAHACPHLLRPVHTCPLLPAPVHSCSYLSTPARTCPHLSTPAHTCSHLSTPVHSCPYLSTSAHTCPQLSTSQSSQVPGWPLPRSCRPRTGWTPEPHPAGGPGCVPGEGQGPRAQGQACSLLHRVTWGHRP